MRNQTKIIVLWSLFLLGMAFHSILAIMPLFFGESITIADSTGVMPISIGWTVLIFYLIPMICITALLYCKKKWHRVVNLLMAVFFAIASLFHLYKELESNITQLILLSFILVITLLLTFSSFKWFKESK